ncbi:Gfo/Idh/MocA family protein [Zavarzinella formosa]|uniref:Gfo/Idh/MocA family protein n=1 Tax=Zavarzinella formosa TaxID=360055 RepID=UPI0002F73F9C|nr:Gfo/Idh/MocA family oxidoreductase [Zavarzinella formosa]
MSELNRRDFVVSGAVAAGALVSMTAGGVHAQGSQAMKVGLIGCGGRGTGAAQNILEADPNVQIVALGDAFEGNVKGALAGLKRKDPKRVTATEETAFHGLDAFEKVLKSDAELVILATPPGFRPYHLEAAINAGKHIFTEKPVAVDVTGIRKVLGLVAKAKEKNLAVVAGTQRRHQTGYLETIKQLHDGAIGEITSARAYWNGNGIWFRDRRPGMTDAEYQLNNWYHFNWLCGDHIVEQHVHNLDVINWVLGTHPIKATGMGGRSNRKVGPAAEVGHIFDHFAVEFEYPNGVIVQSYCRQIEGCANNISESVVGTKGKCNVGGYVINNKYLLEGKNDNAPYVQEHIDLIKSIRAGKPLNELENVATSTMTAILGRMTTYSGKTLEWDKVMKSATEDTFPKNLTLQSALPVSPIPVVGKTNFFGAAG